MHGGDAVRPDGHHRCKAVCGPFQSFAMEPEERLPMPVPICPGSRAAIDRLLNIALLRALCPRGHIDAQSAQADAVSPDQCEHTDRGL
jgi:hypothetical protein